ncbi:MAG: DegT/DnrJ/EryC1/StrS family aminotransferase, partial [Actinomycetota bacterium]|nr:DegT/DnrJ/EryC1/StrS family aminotransferase [Actinomycetota bacterium]
AKRHAAWLAARSPAAAAALPKRRRPYDPAADFAVIGDGHAPSRSSLFLLRRLADPEAAEARRANYRALLARLGDRVPDPFAALPAGAAPFAFPVETDDKERLLAQLRRAGVDALDFWSTPHPALPVEQFPAAARRRARTLALPVHQELRREDLERITGAVGRASA